MQVFGFRFLIFGVHFTLILAPSALVWISQIKNRYILRR